MLYMQLTCFTEPVGKRLRSSPPICSSCKKIKLATSLGIECHMSVV